MNKEDWSFFLVEYTDEFCKTTVKSISINVFILLMSIAGAVILLLMFIAFFIHFKQPKKDKDNFENENDKSFEDTNIHE